MRVYTYVGADPSLAGKTAMGMFDLWGKFLVQLHDKLHPWGTGWHYTTTRDWTHKTPLNWWEH